MFTVLGFDEQLSPGMKQVRDWFLARLARYTASEDWPGCQGAKGRSFALKEVKHLLRLWG